jgi:NADH-quinone oxidoreductase subunit J
MALNQLMFVIFSAIIVIFAILTVTSRKILRAAVYLLFVLISTAGLYFMLSYEFLAAVQLTLYAGGIVVLIIFSILLTSHISENFERPELMKSFSSLLLVIVGAGLTIFTILQFPFETTSEIAADINMKTIGGALLSTGEYGYILPFEVITVLLLAAMIASIVIAKKEK